MWLLPAPHRAIATTALGGGIGERRWVLNAQVPSDYSRTDPDRHLLALAAAAGCIGEGVGFLTAASVDHWTTGSVDGVDAYATVGLHQPVWAAESATASQAGLETRPGTINLVVFAPVALSDAALVNAVTTATEAKTQALVEHRVDGTGTASDALCVLAPAGGESERFCGPRSPVGAALARAVHEAVSAGARAWSIRNDKHAR